MNLRSDRQVADYLRAVRGQTPLEIFARRLRLSRSKYHRIEQCEHGMKLADAIYIARRLNVRIDDMVPAERPRR